MAQAHSQLGGAFAGPEQGIPYGKPSGLADWHPTTIPEHESPFRLGYCLPQHEYTLFRHGESSILTCRIWEDDVRLGCTYIDNTAIRELYWWSNASPRWLRWVVRMWDGWKRRTS
jgi:hypothetical protein